MNITVITTPSGNHRWIAKDAAEVASVGPGFTVTEYAPLPAKPTAAEVERRMLIERTAKVIYGTWSGQRGFVPWTENGNGLKQDEARALAITHRIAKAGTGPGYVMVLSNGTKINGDLNDNGEFFVP